LVVLKGGGQLVKGTAALRTAPCSPPIRSCGCWPCRFALPWYPLVLSSPRLAGAGCSTSWLTVESDRVSQVW